MSQGATTSPPSPPTTPAPPPLAPNQRQKGFLLGLVLAIVLLMMMVFSAGFFLYTAVVVFLVLLLSLLTATLSVQDLHFHRFMPRHEIQLGEDVQVRLLLENKKNFPAYWVFWEDYVEPGLDVEGGRCKFKTLARNDSAEILYRLHSLRRGLFRIGPTVLEASGPVGLVRRFVVSQTVDFLTVLPRVVEMGQGFALGQKPVHEVPRRRSIFEDPSRFIGMREYRPGDSMRAIHWRATARSGTLQVKLFEPAVLTGMLIAADLWLGNYPLSRSKKTVIDPLLELTITTAASLARFVLEGDQEIGLISNGIDTATRHPQHWQGGTFQRIHQALAQTQTPDANTPYQPVEIPSGKGIDQQQRMQIGLARLSPSTSISLPQLLHLEIPRLPRNKVLMIITPQLDLSLYAAVESIKRSGIEVALIWIRLPQDYLPVPQGLPRGIPLFMVRDESDIPALGAQRL